MKRHEQIAAFVLALVLVVQVGQDYISLPSGGPKAAVYVYEKDDTQIPNEILKAIDSLNRAGVTASAFEDDTVDGSGETPEQYKIPLAAAREAGLPSLVVTSGDKVRKVIKNPVTQEAVERAVK